MYESHYEVPIGHLHEPLFAVINLVFFCSFPQNQLVSKNEQRWL
jgi:hypothetical protein